MPRLATPLTDTKVRADKAREKTYTIADGGGKYLEVAPTGLKVWRLAYRQKNGKSNRLTFGTYPEVSLLDARAQRAAARKLLSDEIDPGAAKRDAKSKGHVSSAQTFEAVARQWLTKTAVERAESTQRKNTRLRLAARLNPHTR